MANRVQLFIYRLSTAAPLAMIFALVWYREKRMILLPALCFGISAIMITAFFVSFSYGKRKLAPISVNVIEIMPSDGWIVGYVISYLLPFASIALTDFDYRISAAIAFVIMLVMPFVNSASPNPLLFIVGYHFYSIGTENGIKGYLLISKQRLRNKNQVKSVKQLFEYLLIDERR
jgi:hypothetical protein